MFTFLLKAAKKLFGDRLDFRVRLFNIIAVAGIVISLISCVTGIVTSTGLVSILQTLAMMLFAIWALWYGNVSGRYQFCYIVVIICIFLLLYSALFFNTGGYHSGMPSYFIFAVLFTFFMLDGKKMIIMSVLELSVYTALCLYAYHNPDKINFFDTEKDFLIDVFVGFLVVSVALGITVSFHFRLYNQRQRELEEARRQVEEYARMKSELFAGMSHEMRTPLTVMSAYAQYAVEQIRESGANEQTLADLATISDEAKRLAEMADGTLKVLMTSAVLGVSETDSGGAHQCQPVDVGAVCSRLVKLLEPIALRRGMKLRAVIRENIPAISGDADNVTQLVWNLLQNAITHSESKTIELFVSPLSETDPQASAAPPGVTITVNDDGVGIEPEILPRIFERGVSGKKGGSGIGLTICRDIANRHGGDIRVESAVGVAPAGGIAPANGTGTRVTVVLRGIVETRGFVGGENV